MLYFRCDSISDKGSTVAHCKNDQLDFMELVVQASPEILLLRCVLY